MNNADTQNGKTRADMEVHRLETKLKHVRQDVVSLINNHDHYSHGKITNVLNDILRMVDKS